MLNKLDHYPLNRRIYYKVRELIESGAILPGTQLDERTLANELAVSRTPLREAIATLVEEGLVECRPYHGNFVRMFSAKQVNDLYQVRKALECLAVRLAVPRLLAEDIAQLRRILEQAHSALEQGDIAAYSIVDQHFHLTIAQHSDNEILLEALGRLQRQIQIVRVDANQDPEVVTRTSLEHPRIVAALEVGAVELAAQLMEKHIEGICRSVLARIESSANAENAAKHI